MKEFAVGDKVEMRDVSWNDREQKIVVRGRVVGKRPDVDEDTGEPITRYMIKPLIKDVKELWDVDRQQYMQQYNKPKEVFVHPYTVFNRKKRQYYGYVEEY